MDSILPSLDEYVYDAQKCVSRSARYFLNKASVIISALPHQYHHQAFFALIYGIKLI